jgi:hypothetical protein
MTDLASKARQFAQERRIGYAEHWELLNELADRLDAVQAIVNDQAEDDGLWFEAVTAPEAYLQQELRRLHAVIEGDRHE